MNRFIQWVSSVKFVFHFSEVLNPQGSPQAGRLVPERPSKISPEFGETHATGTSMSPVP